jgi:prepilin-type N-terminal cleavage/methylation domain-containing protein
MKKTYLDKGFTLIELLVVIAIIGILSSVVLASLNTARAKGADAAIKGNLNGIRSQAELYYDSNNSSYGAESVACTSGIFNADPNIKAGIASAVSAGGSAAACFSSDNTTAVTNATSWAVSVPLKSNSALKWCVDSSGTATTTATGATGPATNAVGLAVCA